MHILSVLSVLLLIANVLANKTETDKKIVEKLKLEVPVHQELEALSSTVDASEDKEIKRAKKSTTTTFCVEIRPSGPFQKPFQVCEPAEPAKPPDASQTYSAPAAPAYYPASSYATQEQSKSEAYSASAAFKSPSQPKSGAVYSAPVKTYVEPTTHSPKPYAHGMSFNSYRSKGEERGIEETSGHMMRMTHDNEEDSNSKLGMMSEHQLRSTNYGYGSPNYDSVTHGVSYVPVVPKKQVVQHHDHNGLVITCQPNLAGYAHNVPSSLHHPPAMPYSYRSASPRSSSKYGQYQMLSHAYGSYQQPPQYKAAMNGYKSPSAVHQQPGAPPASSKSVPIQQYGSAYAPPAIYGPPHAQPPASYAPAPYAHLPAPASYSPHPQSQYSQNYAPPPTYVPSGYQPAPAAPSYSSPPAQTAPAPQAQGYGPPGAYSEGDEERRVQASITGDSTLKEKKEEHTLKQMEEMSHQRSSNTQWVSETSQSKFKNKNDEKVESTQKGWSPDMKANEKTDNKESDLLKTNEAENELK